MNSRRPGRSRAARPPLRPYASPAPRRLRLSPPPNGLTRRLRYEPLEDRRLLAVVAVDTVADTVDFNDGRTSLREAIFAANTVPGPDEIRFDPALFASGSATILLKQGELTITDSLTITGPGAELLTIDASGNDPTPDLNNGDGTRVFNISDDDSTTLLDVAISDVSLTGGDIGRDGGAINSQENLQLVSCNIYGNAADHGGGVYVTRGSLSVAISSFSVNVARSDGGAIRILGVANQRLEIKNSQIVGNSAAMRGGGVFAALQNGTADVVDSTLRDNTAMSGGGFYSERGSVTVQGSALTENHARDGGGILLRSGAMTLSNSTIERNTAIVLGGGVASYASLDLNNCVIAANVVTGPDVMGIGAGGGGIFQLGSKLSIATSTISENVADRKGAGLYALNSELSVVASQITENVAGRLDSPGMGGGIYARGSGMTYIQNSLVSQNSVFAGSGGGIFGAMPLTMDQCQISDNSGGVGGGIFHFGNGPLRGLELKSSTITGNSASRNGGGIYAIGKVILITDCIITGNSAGSLTTKLGVGGGVWLRSEFSETARIINSLVADNVAGRFGGGVFVSASAVITASSIVRNVAGNDGGRVLSNGATTITRSLIADNRAGNESSAVGRGGGVFFAANVATLIDSSTLIGNFAGHGGGGLYGGSGTTVLNSTIRGNTARTGGGAQGGSLTFRHSTITNNSAILINGDLGEGGGVFSTAGSAPLLDHTILAGNHADDDSPDLAGGLRAGSRYSIVGDRAGAGLEYEAPVGAPTATGLLIGGPTFGVIDPMLAPLADNGGPTLPGGARLLTHALLPGSPALDAGDPALIAGLGDTPEFDQRGAPYSRVVGRIDIGAVEQIPQLLVVDTLADESDGDYHPSDLSLREAIELANLQQGQNEIQFDPALFTAGPGTILLTHGELEITDALNLLGPGADLLTIDASGNDATPDVKDANGSRLFLISTNGDQTNLEGVTLTGGDVLGAGGAIFLAAGDLRLSKLAVSNNSADRFGGVGGGVYANGSLTIEECTVTNNSAGRSGGGVWANNDTTISFSTISGNTVDGFSQLGGGGLHISSSSRYLELSIQYCEIIGNRVTGADAVGGGVSIPRNVSPAVIASSVISNNSAAGNGGGVSSAARQLRILDTLIAGNSAAQGGGVHGFLAELTRSTVADNDARFGGGFYNAANNSVPRIKSSTISGNSALESGGGLWLTATTNIEHSTIADNRADQDGNGSGSGGGIHGRAVLDHTIVAGNYVGSGGQPSDLDSTTFASFSLIGFNGDTNLTESPLGTRDAFGNLVGGPLHGPIDPRLAPLANNGGFLELPTHALLPGSPAIDAGDPAAIAGGWNTPLSDQRDIPYSRVIGRLDIGAIEQIPQTLVVSTLDDEVDERYHHGALSLREAIELANLQPGHNEIRFDPALFADGAKTILLTHGELKITDSLTITGPETNRLQSVLRGLKIDGGNVNGQGGSRIFNIDDGDAGRASHVTISGLQLANGNALNTTIGDGGAIYSSEPLSLTSLRIDTSRARNGGDVYAAAGLTAVDVIISAGTATANGGGIWAAGDVVLVNSSFFSNSADVYGGAAYFASGSATSPSTVSFQNGFIYDNNASGGAGLFWDEFTAMSIVNTLVSRNRAGFHNPTLARGAAGLFGLGPLVLANSTVVANRLGSSPKPGTAGGMQVAIASITNSIAAGNFGSDFDINVPTGGHIAVSYSLIGHNGGTTLTEAPVGSPDSQGNIIGGPFYGIPNARVGEFGHLASNSPATNAGYPQASGLPPELSEFDYRGAPYARIVGGRIDMGAFEYQAPMGALNADFDFSGHADGLDFLAWQRHFGQPAAATFRQGDATADGDVDSSDLAVWAARFGEGADDVPTGLQPTAATWATLPLMPASPDRAQSAPLRRAAWLADEAAKAAATVRRATVQVVDAALASSTVELAADETEPGELHVNDFNLADWDDALARY